MDGGAEKAGRGKVLQRHKQELRVRLFFVLVPNLVVSSREWSQSGVSSRESEETGARCPIPKAGLSVACLPQAFQTEKKRLLSKAADASRVAVKQELQRREEELLAKHREEIAALDGAVDEPALESAAPPSDQRNGKDTSFLPFFRRLKRRKAEAA